MGADFISYIVFGPYKLSKSKKTLTKAKKRMTDFVELACGIHELSEKAASEGPDAEATEKERQNLMKKSLHNYQEMEDITWARTYKDNPMQLIDELVDVWENASRDSSFRPVPGNKKRKVWVAGEMSWGDEPDGYGYQTMKRADMAGLHEIFGLE